MELHELAPELQELVVQRVTEQGKQARLTLEKSTVGTLFTWGDTPEGATFWNEVDQGRDVTSHPSYPKHLMNYQIY